MIIGGYAYGKNSEEKMKKNFDRYNEIRDTPGVNIIRKPYRNRVDFYGTLETEEAKSLSEFDLALIADNGNLCFGGNCVRLSDSSFAGIYYTD